MYSFFFKPHMELNKLKTQVIPEIKEHFKEKFTKYDDAQIFNMLKDELEHKYAFIENQIYTYKTTIHDLYLSTIFALYLQPDLRETLSGMLV